MPRAASSALVHDASVWVPPPEWREVRPGIWEPRHYAASAWELTPAAVVAPDDELREYVRCAHSLAYFALHYCFALHVDDPDGARARRLPAFPYVRQLLADLQTPSNTISEKSRQMISSWLFMAAFLHDLLFVQDAPALVASRRAKEVDDGGANSTVDSLLGKLRFMHERLPRFLWHPFTYRLYHVRSTKTGSYVRGETGAGGQVARGPAYRRALHDEAAYSKHSESMLAGLTQSCKAGLHLNSTANGKGNAFARLATSKTTTFRKLRIHWTQHPEKAAGLACLCGWQSTDDGPLPGEQFDAHRKRCPREHGPAPTNAWYRSQQANLTPEQIASELDISYERSTGARVFDGYDSTRHLFDVAEQLDRRTRKPIGAPHVGEEPLDYMRRVLAGLIDPGKQLMTFWDLGVSDETFIAIGQPTDDRRQHTRWLAEFVDKGRDWAHYHRLLVNVVYPAYLEACGWTPATIAPWAKKHEYDWTHRTSLVPDFLNEIPRGCLPIYHAADPSGRQRDSSLGSWPRNLVSADPSLLLQSVAFARPEDGSLLEWIDHVRAIVRRDGVLVSSLCTRLADALGAWHWPTDKDGTVVPGRQLPVHDKHSHPGTALVMGYRTRWRGLLVDVENRGRGANLEQIGFADAPTRGRRRTKRDRVETHTKRGGERWLGAQADEDDDERDEFDDDDD